MELFTASYVVPVSSPPIAGGAIAVSEGRIVDVGTVVELRARYGAPVREFPDCVIIPGLVNAHTHLELTHFSSWKIRKGIDYAPRTYVDWIIQVIKIRRALSGQELDLSVREGLRISRESGTTSVGEILTDRSLLPLYSASRLSGRVFFEAIGHDPVRSRELAAGLDEELARFSCGSFQPGLSPHAPHTLSAALHQEVHRLAGQRRVPRMIHLAESRHETDFFFDSSGKIAEQLYPHVRWEEHIPPPRRTTATAWLESLGVFDERTTAVHCVHVNQADAEILKRRGVRVVLCPRSNEKLDVGKAPAYLLKKLGIPLALGTDSLASNDSLSLWDEMRFLAEAFPGVFNPSEVLFMATLGAAHALFLDSEVGSLEKGKRADFLIIEPEGSTTGEGLYESIIRCDNLLEVFSAGTAGV